MAPIDDACGRVIARGRALNMNIPSISCSLDCRPEESDAESYVSGNSSIIHGVGGNNKNKNTKYRRSKSLATFKQNDPVTRRDLLRDRVEEFRAKGWLSHQEHRKYLAFISSFEMTGGGTYGLKELEVELDLLERRCANKPIWNKILTPTGSAFGPKVARATSPSSFNMFSSTNNINGPLSSATNRVVNLATNSGSKTNLKSQQHQQQLDLSKRTIVRPKELVLIMNERLVSELFIDTSFFARLGYIQPPCCMQCTYKESMMGTVPDLECDRWVVWRRNANQIFHPKTLVDNSVVIQCRSARELISGKSVEGYKWGKTSKILIEPRQSR